MTLQSHTWHYFLLKNQHNTVCKSRMVSCGNQNPPEGFLILTLLKQKVESHSSTYTEAVKETGKAEAKRTKIYKKKEFSFNSVQLELSSLM